MKKIIKILSFLILIALLLLIINLCRNFFLIKKSINIGKETVNSALNYHIVAESESNDSNSKVDIYYKDAKYLINTYENDIIKATYYKNYKNGKDSSVLADGQKVDFNDELISKYSLKNLEIITTDITIPRIIVFSATCIIKEDDNYLVIKRNGYTNYYSKETGMLEKRIYKDNEKELISMEINLSDEVINLK